ncbi:restriction endonuclease subunit S [Burkholderia sp. AU19243]|uniref:restriction endonuclease subunit S n=1 Tax=Burkholderia sp. AU19243 TaxID=2824810 RepID=UPI001B94234C|nr:restriction endonuclease subunit S [Burkholderia sp. AU19243]MBR8367153.1 restriction endonuclease subunit S [Burkholderia sp. AU19243]
MKLSEGFQLLATAQDGVARLRELILSLAVRGNLTSRNVCGEPPCKLLQRIRSEREQLIESGQMKVGRAPSPVTNDEKPFDLPSGWQWAKLGSLSLHITDGTHHTPKYVPTGVPFISIKDINGRTISFEDCKFISEEEHELINRRCNPERGDVLICRIGTLGRPTIVDTDVPFSVFVSVGLVKLPKCVDISAYLRLALSSPVLTAQYEQIKAGGSHTQKLNLGDIPQLLIPLPPIEEQAEIVAKVDELMRLCDELEAGGRLEAEQHTRLTANLFEALAASESSHALAENWSRIAAHFDLLLDRPEAVDTLEQTILQLAVRGLLVSQDPNDEPASVVLGEVRAARYRLSAQGKTSRSKTPSKDSDESPTAPRPGWEMVTFPDLCIIGGGATPSKSKAAYWDGKLPWVSPKDMKVEHISDAQDHVSELALEETRLPLVPERSLLIVVRGMILAHSFPVGITQVEVTINQDMKSLTPLVTALAPYLALVCRGHKREILNLVDRSTHGTCKLQSDKLFAFRFGLPPLAEQSRILARVEELRRLCADLRSRLTARQTCQAHFAEALVGLAASTTPLPAPSDDLAAAA